MKKIDYLENMFSIVTEHRYRISEQQNVPVYGVSEEEKLEAYRWARGRDLQGILNHPGYQIIIDYLLSYMEEDANNLLSSPPGDKDVTALQHAVAFASSEIYKKLRRDLDADLKISASTPDIVKEGFRLTKGIPAGPEN